MITTSHWGILVLIGGCFMKLVLSLKKALTLGLALSCFMIFAGVDGCQQNQLTDNVAIEVESLVLKEQQAYRNLIEAKDLRLEKAGNALAVWSFQQTALLNEFYKLTTNNSLSTLTSIKPNIENIFNRNPDLTLAFVPSWQLAKAKADANQAELNNYKLRKLFSKYFKVELADEKPLKITISEDKNLIDTKPECVATFNNFAISCEAFANDNCPHQIDIKCLRNGIKDQAASGNDNSCIKITKVYGTDEIYEVPTSWALKLVAGCQSKTLIEKKEMTLPF